MGNQKEKGFFSFYEVEMDYVYVLLWLRSRLASLVEREILPAVERVIWIPVLTMEIALVVPDFHLHRYVLPLEEVGASYHESGENVLDNFVLSKKKRTPIVVV